MRISNHKLIIGYCFISMILATGCTKSFLEKSPLGPSSQQTLATAAGVNGLLIGAYSALDGWGGPAFTTKAWAGAVSNWIYGGVASDDAHKGSTDNDQSGIARIENFTVDPTSEFINGKWGSLYLGAQRANDVINVMALVTDGSMSESVKKEIKAEAVFLRAFFHFQAAKMWRNVPYVDETITYSNKNYYVDNMVSIWPKIEADFQYAIDNLNATQPEAGRVNSWAAKAFLAEVYMFEHKYTDAKTLLDDIIAHGVTSSGVKYALLPNFADNFDPTDDNNSEGVFEVQMTVQDGAKGQNGNIGDLLNFPYGGPATCCGFYQPSFSLVNSYKTDPATGLPLLNTWNDADMTNDQNLSSDDPFTPYTGTVDPRLDFTVGRRGIPFLDWGVFPGKSWIRAQSTGGPYVYKKNVVSSANQAAYTDLALGWAAHQATAINYKVIRFSDILLLAAEAEVEVGSLSQAEDYVNMVRARAANPLYWVHTYVDTDDPSKGFTNVPAANYKIELYPSGQFEANGQDYARRAVRFERKIELAMEGHRFFDLQRWDNGTGYMADVLNAYISHENNVAGYNGQILKAATFTRGKNELYPIPQNQIDLSKQGGSSTLIQNPNY